MKRTLYVFAVLAMAFGLAQAQNPQTPQSQQPASQQQIPPSDSNPGARPATNPATTPPPSSMPFDQYDKDTDGNLSRSEFDGAAMKGTTFAQVDTNGDGRISRDEWAAHNQPRNQDRR